MSRVKFFTCMTKTLFEVTLKTTFLTSYLGTQFKNLQVHNNDGYSKNLR